MADWPVSGSPNRVIIGPHSAQAGGVEFAALASAAPASVAHGTINLARFYPFYLSEPIVVVKVWWINGATVNGNTDVGIYTADGTRLISSGAVAQATTGAMQEVDTTDTLLGRGTYYAGISSSSATATYFSNAINVHFAKSFGWAQMASAHVLPATVTLAALAAAIQPMFGVSARTVLAT